MGADGSAAYDRWLDAAARAGAALREAHGDADALERADRDAFLAQVLETGLQLVTVDAGRPAFTPWQTATRRYADNGPDSVYGMAWVDERHRYRISGRRGDECYLSISLYALDSGQPDRQVVSVNHLDLDAGPGEPFTLDLEPSDGGAMVLTRQYLVDPARDVRGTFSIEVVDGPRADRAVDATTDDGWDRAARCVLALTGATTSDAPPPPWVSRTPNVLGDPTSWATDPARGAADQAYASGPFELGFDEALVMETVLPRAAYASVTAWNRFGQSIDARFHRSTINHHDVIVGDDGATRIVLAGRDPGVPNWLDTGGRRRGTVFWRFLLVDGPLHPITCRVVAIDQLRRAPGA
jgi:hypothetical protein